MSLPPFLQIHVDEVLGVLRTGGEVIFTDEAGVETSVSLWFVLCPTRCWLVAGFADQVFATASSVVSLDKGWTSDAVQVGAWSAPLRRGGRSNADALLQRFTEQPGGGEAVEPPAPVLGGARIASGAEVPDWVAAEVPEDPAARWLYAWQSAESHAFPGRDGRPDRRPLWVVVSDHGLWLAAAGGLNRQVQELEGRGRRGLREQVRVDGRFLTGAVVDRRREELLALAAADGFSRWGLLLEILIDAGEGKRAVAIAAEAFNLARHASCWRGLGTLAWASRDTEKALQAAFVAVGDPRELVDAFERSAPQVQLPRGPFAEVSLPDLPDGLPAATTASGVVATASILRGDVEAGLEIWARVPGPISVSVQAAVEASGLAWEHAAAAWRPVDPTRAEQELERALALEATPGRLYLAAAWAHEDSRAPEPYWLRAFPEPPPDDFEQPPATWQLLADTASGEAIEPWVVAKIALGSPDDLWEAAQALRDTLHRPEEALALLVQVSLCKTDRARWSVLAECAELQRRLDRIGEAEESLRELVAHDFLVPEALDRGLELGAGLIDDPELARWAHLRAQLDASHAPPIPPRALDRDTLDGLHPGGVGWLERVRHQIDTAEPPQRSSLVRGLEVVSERTWPDLAAVVAELCEAFAIDAPPIYLFRGEGAHGMSAWPTEPPLLLIGHHHLSEAHAQSLTLPGLRFALAVEFAHLAAEHPLLAFDGGIVGTSRSVYETFGAYAGAAETFVDVITLLPGIDQIGKIQTVVRLSRRVFAASTVLDKATDAARQGAGWLSGPEEERVGRRFRGAALQFRLQADRAAWWVTGDLEAAIDAMAAAHPETVHLRKVFAEQGVLPLLESEHVDLKVRIASLLGFVASSGT